MIDRTQMRLTADGEAKAKAWRDAQDRLESAHREVSSAEVNLRNVANDFGRWLMPPNAKKGHTAAVWMGDTLVQATMIDANGHGTFRIELRYEGPGWKRR